MTDRLPEPDRTLPRRFFDEVREVSLGTKNAVDFEAADIVRIAEDAALTAEFRKLFNTGINNPEERELIREILERMADELEEAAKLQGVDSHLIERFGTIPPAAALTVALGTILHGVTNPVGAVVAATVAGLGIIGICISGLGTRTMKRREVLSDADMRKVRRLAGSLGDKK